MYDKIQQKLDYSGSEEIYKPHFYRLHIKKDKEKLSQLINENICLSIFDEYQSQLKELVKLRNPSRSLSEDEMKAEIEQVLQGQRMEDHGVWVHYPWSSRLVHILDEEEFIEVRTSRNQYKITNEERQKLANVSIGIIGLSVGQSIALTMAMERTFGTLKLADFDVLELSNLNRIRSGVHNLGLSKVINVAREIAEIDPYLNIEIIKEGISKENIEDFLISGKKLDILVDECDSLGVKIMAREKAKKYKIPVVMDTSDRGMIDIERFDLEPDRPLFHGILKKVHIENPHQLSREEHIQLAMAIAGGDQISDRAKKSMAELGKTITTWPQLASSVVLGGAVGTDVCRRIALGHLKTSGRFYIDLDMLIADKD